MICHTEEKKIIQTRAVEILVTSPGREVASKVQAGVDRE
jgi:hypothetical protein